MAAACLATSAASAAATSAAASAAAAFVVPADGVCSPMGRSHSLQHSSCT
eukprot:m.275286 g.275286  ORF g.275286 m.275286 type:complete len:50 (-) comp19351_c1_seq8:36-185(-)